MPPMHIACWNIDKKHVTAVGWHCQQLNANELDVVLNCGTQQEIAIIMCKTLGHDKVSGRHVTHHSTHMIHPEPKCIWLR